MATTANFSTIVPRWRNHQFVSTEMSPMAAASSTSPISTAKNTPPVPHHCICLRKRSKVTCNSCGYFISYARVVTPCTQHPNQYYLLDISSCPNCRAAVSSMKEQGF